MVVVALVKITCNGGAIGGECLVCALTGTVTNAKECRPEGAKETVKRRFGNQHLIGYLVFNMHKLE